ncbi:unnamed protein product [Linum tenue]|uniref:Uncharacterized protein n=1 Tax=Linum tenue TaxID=586396 RepID=A0AAV0K475_9ROSI|nr:unnamed protein product [Linum tenue]
MVTNPSQDHHAAAASSDGASPSATNRFPDYESDDLDESSAAASPSFCLCFPARCFGRRSAGSHAYLLQVNQDRHSSEDQEPRGGGGGGRRWVAEKLKKAREVSELVAGPKWKNFIRRFSGTVRAAVGSVANKANGRIKRPSKMQFQYDAQSYALNFDDGVDTADDCGYPGFSARYAVPPPPPSGGSNGVTTKAASQLDT